MSYFKTKCPKFDFGLGSAIDPLGELTVLPDLLAGFKGPTSKGREGRKDGRKRQGRRREKGRIGEGKGGNGEEDFQQFPQICHYTTGRQLQTIQTIAVNISVCDLTDHDAL